MKTRKFLWAVLPMMAAALTMTACGGDDVADTKPVPVSPTDKTDVTQKTIPYTVTVTGDPETTRATTDGLVMKFADGDKLYVQNSGGDIHGVLTIDEGIGNGHATFSGDLYYEASNPPTTSTSLTATLVSSDDEVAQISSDDKVTGFTYPTENNVCSTLAEAVSKYSQLQGTANYGSTFTLTQSTAFLKFKVWLEDGTLPTEKAVAVSVTKDGSNTIGTGTVSASGTTRFVDTYAEFYVPVPYNTTITTDATMCIANVGSDDESITYGGTADKTLSGGKVYNITKTKDFVRLWAGGPVWATKNLGASSVTDYGNYYAWGNTDGYAQSESHDFDWPLCAYCIYSAETKTLTTLEKYNFNANYGEVDNKTQLEYDDDAAYVASSGTWRMPILTEFEALLSNTKYKWTTGSVNGGMFSGKEESSYKDKAIFLPAAGSRAGNKLYYQTESGCYWSSTIDMTDVEDGSGLHFSSGLADTECDTRYTGRSVRPVHD